MSDNTIRASLCRAVADASGLKWDECAPRIASAIDRDVTAVLTALHRRFYVIERAMLESRARDDEGEFPILLDLLDFSGDNKAHTVAAAAWDAAINAILSTPPVRRAAV